MFPDLVQYDKQSKPFTIYYHLLTPMILNQLQREHAKSEAQNAKISTQTTTLQKQSAELASLKQAQAEQQKLLVKLAAYVQSTKPNAPIQKVNIVQHQGV